MTVVVTFERFKPPDRFDAIPWDEVRIEEADAEDGSFAQIDAQPLSPTDPDPTAPAFRSFTTSLGTAGEQWYRIIFADTNGDTSEPTSPLQNLAIAGVSVDDPFVSTNELAAILQVREADNHDALERCLLAAAGEIVTETGRSDFAGWELSLVEQVNLARAEELWKQMKAPWGVIMTSGPAAEFGPARIARDTFERHALTLSPLKVAWGIA
jgi:hypothetical protein